MASLTSLGPPPRALTLLICALFPVAAAVACGTDDGPSADQGDSASGGTPPTSGGNGPSSGGGTSSGGQIATDAPAVGGGASSGGGGAGGAGGGEGRTGPCYDEPCPGLCEGSCAEGFSCNEESDVACAAVITTVCGCDGETFTLPSACPTMGYDHAGECNGSGDSYDCNPDHILCLPIVAPEPCPAGEVYSVVSSCYGDCVPIGQCACASGADCPDPNDIDEYTCHGTTDRCGPWL
jgi:hypothetical protein